MKILITGATGLIGRQILNNLLSVNQEIFLLVRDINSLDDDVAANKKIKIFVGDISKRGLGLNARDLNFIRHNVEVVFHCAALYNTHAKWVELAKNNLTATKNIISFLKSCSKKPILNYLSTLYVCGNFTGVFPEDFLPSIKSFHNQYERSKYVTERYVRGVYTRANIFRVPMVVGDSRTGNTSKFDGVYRVFDLATKSKVFVYPGAATGRLEILPVDFVADFIVSSGLDDKRVGVTYNMVSGDKLRYHTLFDCVLKIVKYDGIVIRIPGVLWKFVPKFGALNMFNQDIEFVSENFNRKMHELDLNAPNVDLYLKNVINYYKSNS